MIIRPRKKTKNTVDSGAGVGTRSYGAKNIFYARDGVQVRERKLGDRILYSAEAPGKWIHPWFTTVGWFTEESGALKNNKGVAISGFAAVVKPGFVNGIDPVCPGSQKIKVGQKETSSDLLGGGDAQDILEEPGLMDGPLIPFFDTFGLMSRGIPAGLTDLGAVPYVGSESLSGNASSGYTIKQTLLGSFDSSERYVASSDIYLQCARPTSQMDVSTYNYPFEAIEYNVSFNTSVLDRLGIRAGLRVGSMPPNLKPTIMDKLFGTGYTDPGIDCFLIATVYLLSPENPEMGAMGPIVTEAWVPYVKHHTFWNLEYRWKLVVPVNKPAKTDLSLLPITGRYTLAGQGMLAAGGSELNRLMAAVFNAKNTEGKFWTI
jgi:hypothetical protein